LIKLSKNQEEFTVNGREYRTKKWSTITTMLEGKKLLLALAPSFTTMADMKLATSKDEPTLDEIVEGSDIEFLLTGAISQLSANFSDEHFESLCEKLLSNFDYRERREDGEFGDYEKITDWSEHFDEYGEDFEQVIVKSAKVNLYDFFMKQATVRSSIEKVLTVVKPLATQIEKNLNVDGN